MSDTFTAARHSVSAGDFVFLRDYGSNGTWAFVISDPEAITGDRVPHTSAQFLLPSGRTCEWQIFNDEVTFSTVVPDAFSIESISDAAARHKAVLADSRDALSNLATMRGITAAVSGGRKDIAGSLVRWLHEA